MATKLTSVFAHIADGLAESGYSIVDGFLNLKEADTILHSDEFKGGMLHFRKAAVGKTEKHISDRIRGDYIQWIDSKTASAGEHIYLARLKEMIVYLNQNLYLSLKGVEIHRTIYPIGTKYERHVDQFRSDDHRKLSLICYLNPGWTQDQGGQLRLYLPEGHRNVLPESGRLVCFRSDLIEHEVLSALRERYSLTGWAIDYDPDIR